VETLKRDWSSTLKLRDVLVTISCLLIQPNPASALNEAAGKLATEDWNGYCRRAKLMTDCHAAIPSNIAKDVREAQMRGEDKTTEPEQSIAKPHSKGKEKERVKLTPSGPKLQRPKEEDEENRRRRGATRELGNDSDPESDWIPGPVKTNKPAPRRENNIFGIEGLEDTTMQLDTPPKRIFAAEPAEEEKGNVGEVSDPFIEVTSKRNLPTSNSFDLRILPFTTTQQEEQMEIGKDTPDLLKFSHQNPFSAIQLNNQTHPLFKEFSYSWEQAAVLHDTLSLRGSEDGKGNGGGGLGKLETRKRMAGGEFEKKREWEMKRFKRAGCDLGRYNRGDFGARTGVGRL
jgi:ubiquitin-conjugating enzyme E2 S